MVVFLLRSATRCASSLSRFQCTTMKARTSGIAANRYLTLSSSSLSGSGRSSTGNGNIGSGGGRFPTEGSGTNPENLVTLSSNKDPSSGSPPPTATEYVYIHPLSQIILQNLQSKECHEWITRAGFDRNLTVHKDGTFSLESLTTTASSTRARIWTEYCADEKKHWLIYSSSTGGDRSSSSADDYMNPTTEAATTTTTTAVAAATTVQHKYLLQDNLRTAWQKGTKSTSAPDRIQEFVRELMLIVR
jgi:hypothetical protein